MPCKPYKDALIKAAASGGELPVELRSHLAGCAECRAAFEQERALLAAIDSGLFAAANADVPASLLPRVRARLNEAVVSRRRWMQPLIFASASVAVALLFLLIGRPYRHVSDDQARQVLASPAPVPLPANTQMISPSGNQIAPMVANHPHTGWKSTLYRPVASSKPEVLVPPDEREALGRFVASLNKRTDFAQALLAPGSKRKDTLINVDPLQIAEIEVQALEAQGTAVPDHTREMH